MYWTLLAVTEWDATLSFALNILKVAVGLGFVIFVHELGHFLVAKACGVKCEKFYIGFDVPLKIGPIQFPSRLGRFQWGETEYGIGILPLGGYVKMLGQDDDPRMAQQEAERIRIRKEDAGEEDTSDESYELDPRSFPAKPVPHRMMIISAGVIMNLIFAVIFATYAFTVGVPFTPTEIGGTVPGSPAWLGGLESGARIVQIGDRGEPSEKLRFDWDLRNSGVGLAQDKEDLPLLVRYPDGEEKRFEIRPMITKKALGKVPMLGVAMPRTLTIGKAIENRAAASASQEFKTGDKVVAVEGTSVGDYYEFEELLAANPDGDLRLTIERPAEEEGQDPTQIDVVVPPNPLNRLGLTMRHGPITGIRPGSPAEQAGFQVGDLLQEINGQPLSDPVILPVLLRPLYGQQVSVQVLRDGEEVVLEVTPEVPKVLDWTAGSGFPMAAESLGIAFSVELTVRAVDPEGPAAGKIEVGDTFVGIAFRSDDPDEQVVNKGKEIELGGENGVDWMFVFTAIQYEGPQSTIVLRYQRGGVEGTAELKPVPSEETNPDRGLAMSVKTEIYTADSLSEALVMGYRQVVQDASRVLTFLKKLFTGELSISSVGGPLMILTVAGSEASQGIPRLLMFLTFLSANLAVLNFLPIPALDGGHMLFLIAEGIRGKPVDERLQVALTLAGVAGLLCLMIFVSSMDIRRIFFL